MGLTRSDLILKYIIEHFIKNAQPVASQTLIDEYKLDVSSATIRNEMMELEKLGFLEKTHTSSGRVPSMKAYKYYCDKLRDGSVDEKLKNALAVVLEKKTQSIEEVIAASCNILSHMTNLVSIVMGPGKEMEKLANVTLVKTNDNTVTAIFTTNKAYVEKKTFIVPKHIKISELVNCVNMLNKYLVDTAITDLVKKVEALRPILSDYIISHTLIYEALIETFVKFASDRLSFYGREELFSNPEYQNDAEKLMKILKMLSNREVLKKIDDESRQNKDALTLRIGDIANNPDVSVVSAKIKVGENDENTITLLGPTRMDYDKVLSALEYFVNELENYFKKNGGRNNDGQA